MPNLKGERAMEGTKPARRFCRTSKILAEIIEPHRMEEDEVNCNSGAPALDITPEAHHELQRTISEVARCVDGNDRLSTICIRYVEALNEKHRLAQQLREEQALRSKVLETKDRLVTVCKRLQEQSIELRREHFYDEKETKPPAERVVFRTHLGLVRKHLDLEKYKNRNRDGDYLKDNEDSTKLKKRSLSFKDVSTDTKDVDDCENKSVESLSMVEKCVKTTQLEATSMASLSEKSNVEIEEKERLPRTSRLSYVAVTQSDIPPTEQGCTTRQIGISRASTDLTRR